MAAVEFITSSKANVIVGGQFGSESKGLVAAYIAGTITKEFPTGPLYCTTNAGAQAGHTTILPDGTKFITFHLPTVGVLVETAKIYLNAGSIIDLGLLRDEVLRVSEALGRDPEALWSRITIHPHATVITGESRDIERNGATRHIGSTQKGVGAALAFKVMRVPETVFEGHEEAYRPGLAGAIDLERHTTLIEIPQGTGLSLNSSGFYPKTTSRECWVGQGLVDAALHPSALGMVSMVVRTFPIRVGHIFDDGDEIVGDSGPFYNDGEEIAWTDLPGVEPERTTVTQRVRRIAKWSAKQYHHGLRMNKPNHVFLTFTNYCTPDELREIVLSMRETEAAANVRGVKHFFSWGPKTDQISDIYANALPHCRQP